MTDSAASDDQPRKTVSEIFREHGYPPMDDERQAKVEATRLEGLPMPSAAALSEKEALERVVAVLDEYRDRPNYVNFAVAALILDALRWPRSDGTVPQ